MLTEATQPVLVVEATAQQIRCGTHTDNVWEGMNAEINKWLVYFCYSAKMLKLGFLDD